MGAPTDAITLFPTPHHPSPLPPLLISTRIPETEPPLLGFGFSAQNANPHVHYRTSASTDTITSFLTPHHHFPSPLLFVSTSTPGTEPPPFGFGFLAQTPSAPHIIERVSQPVLPLHSRLLTNPLHCPPCLFPPAHPQPSHHSGLVFGPKPPPCRALSISCPH